MRLRLPAGTTAAGWRSTWRPTPAIRRLLRPARPTRPATSTDLTGWAVGAGIELHDLAVARPSLEDTYLALTGHQQAESTAEPAPTGRRRRRRG